MMIRGYKVSLRFVWFDLWIGLFIDLPRMKFYLCLLPCVVLCVEKDMGPKEWTRVCG